MYPFIFSTSGWKYYAHSTYNAKPGAKTKIVPKMVLRLLRRSIDPQNIILEPKSHTAYCFNHKVASTAWMRLFTKMHAEEKNFKSIVDSKAYYKYED